MERLELGFIVDNHARFSQNLRRSDFVIPTRENFSALFLPDVDIRFASLRDLQTGFTSSNIAHFQQRSAYVSQQGADHLAVNRTEIARRFGPGVDAPRKRP